MEQLIKDLEDIRWAIVHYKGLKEMHLADSKKEYNQWTGYTAKLLRQAEIDQMVIDRLKLRFKKTLSKLNEETQRWK